ncbi:MAG: D-2-hydroxyacid dehydrogenase, partial [Pseudomonadota bacterium]
AAAAPGLELIAVDSQALAVEAAGEADAIIGYCNPQVVAAAAKASWIQIFSAGAERCLDVTPVGSGEIVLTNMQKMSAPVIGEHAIAMLLALGRELPRYARLMPEGRWERSASADGGMFPVAGRTLLVVGLGGIGSEVAKRGKALGMRVIATRNSSRSGPPYVDYVGLSDELHVLAREAHVIVNALPLTPATEATFDADFFAAARKGALFISVGRGKTTVTDDLVAALREGQIGGAGLDVTDPEPLPAEHPLWQFDNVIITPHVSWRGGTQERHMLLVRENLRRFAKGERLYNVVDPQKGY